jgi:hypothetical protein
LNFIIKIFSF